MVTNDIPTHLKKLYFKIISDWISLWFKCQQNLYLSFRGITGLCAALGSNFLPIADPVS